MVIDIGRSGIVINQHQRKDGVIRNSRPLIGQDRSCAPELKVTSKRTACTGPPGAKTSRLYFGSRAVSMTSKAVIVWVEW